MFRNVLLGIRLLILTSVLSACSIPTTRHEAIAQATIMTEPGVNPHALAFFDDPVEIEPVSADEKNPSSTEVAPIISVSFLPMKPAFQGEAGSLPAAHRRESMVFNASTSTPLVYQDHVPILHHLESSESCDPYHSLPPEESTARLIQEDKAPEKNAIEPHTENMTSEPVHEASLKKRPHSFRDVKIEIRDDFAIYLYFGMMVTLSIAAAGMITHERLQARRRDKILEDHRLRL